MIPFSSIPQKAKKMRSFLLSLALLSLTEGVNANECDAVLIPSINAFETNVRTALNTLSVIQHNAAEDSSTKDQFSATVPIFKIPVEFGYQSEDASKFRESTLSYFNQRFSKDESISRLISEVSSDKTDAWLKCMQKHSEFLIYFNPQTITPTTATLWLRRWVTGSPRTSKVHLKITGGTLDGRSEIDLTMIENGFVPTLDTRESGGRLTVEATMDSGEPSTAIIPESDPPPRFPEISIRIHGNLQKAKYDQTFTDFTDLIVEKKGIKFNRNEISLTIDEVVNGKVCQSRPITSAAMGDSMNRTAVWRLDEMKAGCQVLASSANVIAVSAVRCNVDPLYFAQCR